MEGAFGSIAAWFPILSPSLYANPNAFFYRIEWQPAIRCPGSTWDTSSSFFAEAGPNWLPDL